MPASRELAPPEPRNDAIEPPSDNARPTPSARSAGPRLLDRRLVFVLGKGGVGRSTVAAALGLLAARRGRRAIVVEVAARGDVPRLFGHVCTPGAESELASGLWTLAVDPGQALEEYLRDQLPGRLLAELISSSGTAGYVAAATPGLRELLTVGKIWELAQEQRRPADVEPYDVVIVDAPATGHGLALLEAPRTFSQAAQIGPIARQGAIIDETLRDRTTTAMAAVATPEQAALDELLVLRAALGGRLDAELVNGVAPARFSADDARVLRDAQRRLELPGAIRHALAAALGEERRSCEQRSQIDRLDAPLELPLIAAPEISARGLEALGDALAEAV